MKQYLKGLFVAAVPATLGILFGLGVIFYSINHAHKTEEASATVEDSKQTASGDADSAIKSFVKQNCATCHGADLKGMVGPSLVEAGQKLSEEEIVKILKEGKGTRMPKGLATGKEAEVAKYLKSLK